MNYFLLQTLSYILLLAGILITLPGCATKGDTITQVVYKTKYIAVQVPSELTTPTTITAVKSTEDYLALPLHERESYLTDYATDALKSLSLCNAKLSSIQTLIEEQYKEIEHASEP